MWHISLIARARGAVSKCGGAEQRWEQVRWGLRNIFETTPFISLENAPFYKDFPLTLIFIYSRFRKEVNKFKKRHYNGQQN